MVYDSFNIEEDKRIFNNDFNPLKPFSRPLLESLSKISVWVTVIMAFLFIAIWVDGSGRNIKTFQADNSKVYQEKFTLKSNRYLSSLKLTASSHKILSNFNIQIHKEKQLVFSLNGKRAYTFKEGSTQIETKFNQWDKDAKAVTIYLKLKKLGEYTITVKPIDKTLKSTLGISIYEQDSRLSYFIIFFLLLVITLFMHKYSKWRYKRQQAEERGIYYD